MKTDYNKLKKEFLDYLKKERGFSDYTVKSYNIDIKIFFDFCKKNSLNDPSPRIWEEGVKLKG